MFSEISGGNSLNEKKRFQVLLKGGEYVAGLNGVGRSYQIFGAAAPKAFAPVAFRVLQS